MNLLKAALVMVVIMGFVWLMVEATRLWQELFGEWAFLSGIFVFGTLVLWAGSK